MHLRRESMVVVEQVREVVLVRLAVLEDFGRVGVEWVRHGGPSNITALFRREEESDGL